jgi:hypothetical protein
LKRVFTIIYELIQYPFRMAYLILSFPFKILLIIYQDKKNTRKRKIKNTKIDSLEIGQLLYPDPKKEIQTFLNLYHADFEKFKNKYCKILKNYNDFDLENLRPIEMLYIFGDNKQLINLTDWRGEENLNEIKEYIEKQLKQEIGWTNTTNLRAKVNEELQTDGKFIIDLFKHIDKDLQTINQKLIFFNLNWDSYVFKTIDCLTFELITNKASDFFHGTENL